MKDDIPFLILEADQRIGGRVKTDRRDGFILNHGFQVLQTAYPEARQLLDYERLALRPFAAGAIIYIDGNFHRVADPWRHPQALWHTLTAPIGTLMDRLRIIRLVMSVRRGPHARIFQSQDTSTMEYLRSCGFSETMIQRFLKPFFAGVCLDPDIETSSRVFRYVFRIFAEGTVALPGDGMAAIVDQMRNILPPERIRTGNRVASVHPEGVVLETGEHLNGGAVVLATEGPETARLLGATEAVGSRGEWCLYYAAKEPPITGPYLVLNGDGTGWVNSLTVPSIVAPSYAPAGQHLISVVVIGHAAEDDATVEETVRGELSDWFGRGVRQWRHLETYRIAHALPEQNPPMPDPTVRSAAIRPGIYVCGEYDSVPGIQWALLSGRQTAEEVLKMMNSNR